MVKISKTAFMNIAWLVMALEESNLEELENVNAIMTALERIKPEIEEKFVSICKRDEYAKALRERKSQDA